LKIIDRQLLLERKERDEERADKDSKTPVPMAMGHEVA
jgi:hypothetical protein